MRRLPSWLLPAAFVAIIVVGLPVVALTDTGVERKLRDKTGIGAASSCTPRISESAAWRPLAPLPGARDEPRAVTVDGKIYLAGGITAITDYGKPSDTPGVKERVAVDSLSTFTRFDPRSGVYVDLAPMPEALNHIGIVAHGGDIYVVGGHGKLLNGEDPKDGLYRYSIKRNTWTRLAPMPTARGAIAVGVVGDRLYVAGGMTAGHALATVEAYDFGDRHWRRVADLPDPREHVAKAVLGGRFYVLGGRNRFTDALPDVTRYDPARDRWERIAKLPVGVGGAEALAYDDAIYVIGGGNDRGRTVSGAVQRFDPVSGRWTELSAMRTARHGFGSAVADGRVYTFGGSPCALFAASDVVDVFDPRMER